MPKPALPHGFFSPGDVASYRSLARRAPVPKLIEVGTYRGRSVCSIADVIRERKLTVFTYDTFDWTHPVHSDLPESPREEAVRAVREHGISGHVVIRKGDASADAECVADESCGLVFIDGDHRFESVLRDLCSWWPKVAPGGLIAGHDYSQDIDNVFVLQVKAAVDRTFGRERVFKLHRRSTVWAVQKAGDSTDPVVETPSWLRHYQQGATQGGQGGMKELARVEKRP